MAGVNVKGWTMRITREAASRIRGLLYADGRPGAFFRVSVEGGGCQGFSYVFSVTCAPEEGDAAHEGEGASVMVDAASAPFLEGAALDWESSITGERFRVVNPNASSSCGCGVSFSA